jgi:hypothetical protein
MSAYEYSGKNILFTAGKLPENSSDRQIEAKQPSLPRI